MNKLEELKLIRLQKIESLEAFEKSGAYKILIEPLKDELESLKSAYDCKTLIELAKLGGYRNGLLFILDEMERIRADGEIARKQNIKKELDIEEPKEI